VVEKKKVEGIVKKMIMELWVICEGGRRISKVFPLGKKSLMHQLEICADKKAEIVGKAENTTEKN